MSLTPPREDRVRSALLTLDLHRLAGLARSHVPSGQPADPREAHAWVDVMLRAPGELHRVVGSCTANELLRMCHHVGIAVDPQDSGIHPILAHQVSGALGLHSAYGE